MTLSRAGEAVFERARRAYLTPLLGPVLAEAFTEASNQMRQEAGMAVSEDHAEGLRWASDMLADWADSYREMTQESALETGESS